MNGAIDLAADTRVPGPLEPSPGPAGPVTRPDGGVRPRLGGGPGPSPSGGSDESALVARLRAGDEAAFVTLVERHGSALRRLARMYTSDALADDVVQETWVAVLRGIDRFEGRAALRTWIFRILINIARDRAEREHRQIPFSAFADPSDSEPSVEPDRFQQAGDRFPGGWVSFPERWDEQPEARYLSSEGVALAREAIAALPPAQREVVSLRDVEGWSSDEVSVALGITPGNQRVLLHRGRSKVRAALEAAMNEARSATRGAHMDRSHDTVVHPDLEHYYDTGTDRSAIDRHLAGCAECRAWLVDIHERLRDLPCRQFVELVTDYLDSAVDERLRERIDDHLRLCEGCRGYLDELGATIATIGGLAGEAKPSETVRAGLLVAFRAWRRRDPGDASRGR